jgi:hypothetical protein
MKGPTDVSRPGVLETQSEDLKVSGALRIPCKGQRCLEEHEGTRFLSNACLGVQNQTSN